MSVIHPFYDVHTHLCGYGISLNRPDIGGAASFHDAVSTVRGWMKGRKFGVIVATGFDETGWAVKRVPTKAELDAAFPNMPVIFRRVCGHIACANSLALERIGPEWGIVHRDTGLLEEGVVLRINDAVGVSEQEMLEGARRGIDAALRLGIAGVGEVCSLAQFRAMARLAGEGMPINIAAFLPFDDAMALLNSGVKPGRHAGSLHFRGVKLFLDGSLGGRTAALSADYADAPGCSGLLLLSNENLASIVKSCEERGLQLMMHAIGDRAVSQALDAIERNATRGNPLGHRLEHAEVMDAGLIARVKNLGARLSLQPNFAGRWSGKGGMNWMRLGAERHRWCNPYRSISDAGIACAFGSDCMPLDPFFGLRSATGHPVVEERLSRDRALEMYTKGAAQFLGFQTGADDELELTADPFGAGCSAMHLVISGKRVF